MFYLSCCIVMKSEVALVGRSVYFYECSAISRSKLVACPVCEDFEIRDISWQLTELQEEYSLRKTLQYIVMFELNRFFAHLGSLKSVTTKDTTRIVSSASFITWLVESLT